MPNDCFATDFCFEDVFEVSSNVDDFTDPLPCLLSPVSTPVRHIVKEPEIQLHPSPISSLEESSTPVEGVKENVVPDKKPIKQRLSVPATAEKSKTRTGASSDQSKQLTKRSRSYESHDVLKKSRITRPIDKHHHRPLFKQPLKPIQLQSEVHRTTCDESFDNDRRRERSGDHRRQLDHHLTKQSSSSESRQDYFHWKSHQQHATSARMDRLSSQQLQWLQRMPQHWQR